MSVLDFRKPDHPIDPLFVERWSHRAYSSDEIADDELFRFFEAARWAPSARNAQPWRFLYSKRHDSHWDAFTGLIAPRNRVWSDQAAALVFILSAQTVEQDGKPVALVNHSFDAGAAWANFALQAHLAGWSTRAIGNFDRARAPQVLKVPADFTVEIAVAVGRPGPADSLPEDLRDREAPNGRRPIAELVARGPFGWEG